MNSITTQSPISTSVKRWFHAFDNLLEVWSDGQMIASHPRRLHPGNSTAAEHMPERHRHHQQWTPERLKSWAAGVGSDTFTWVSERLAGIRTVFVACVWGC